MKKRTWNLIGVQWENRESKHIVELKHNFLLHYKLAFAFLICQKIPMVSSVQENHISTVSSSYHHPNQLYSIMSSGLSLAKDLTLVFAFMRKGTFSVQPFPAESVWIWRRLQLPPLFLTPATYATRSSIALCSSPN